MATTTATINLTSPDITGDPLNLIKTATLTKAASNTGLDQFTGVTTVVYAAAQSNTNICRNSCNLNIKSSCVRYEHPVSWIKPSDNYIPF